MKKLLFLTVLSMLFAVNAAAQTTKSGKIGTSINWTYDIESGELTLSGSGEIPSTSAGKSYFSTNDQAIIYSFPVGGDTYDIYITDLVKNIIINGSITKLGNNCFTNSKSLKTVTVESPLKEIGVGAFYACSELETFVYENIPQDIVIGEDAFYGCTKLLDNGVLILGNTLVKAYADEMENTTYSIPDRVTKINPEAFSKNGKLVSITIPASVKTIGKVFDGCSNLTNVTFSGDINSIGNDAFNGCSNLTTVTFNGDINSIGDRVFENCSSLHNINIPSSVKTWGKDIFSGCTYLPNDGTYQKAGDHVIVKVVATEETDYTIPGNIIYIAEEAFIGCTQAQNIFSQHSYGKMPKAASSAFDFDGFEPNYYVADGNEEACKTNWKAIESKINHTQITVGKTGYATVTILHHSAKVPDGIEAYTAKVEGDQVKLSKVLELAKGEGYILIGDTKTHDFGPAKKEVTKPKNNSMVGVTTDTEVSGYDCYVLCPADNGGVEFLCVGSETARITAGKSYLYVPNSPARLSIYNDNNETGIEETSEYHNTQNNNSIYNLAGQKLTQPKKGLNVINGKLVLM